MEAWASISCTARLSAPLAKRAVAKLWRNVGGGIFFPPKADPPLADMSAIFMYFLMMRWTERGVKPVFVSPMDSISLSADSLALWRMNKALELSSRFFKYWPRVSPADLEINTTRNLSPLP